MRTPDVAYEARDRHSHYYTSLLTQGAQTLQGRGQEAALGELQAELENIRAAWQWAAQRGDVAAILNAVHGLWLFSEITGRYAEAVGAFADAVRAVETAAADDPASVRTRALTLGRLLAYQGSFVYRLGGVDAANRLIDRAIELLRPLDSPGDLGLALNFKAMGAHAHQDYAAEEHYLAESIECLSRAGRTWGLAYSINDLGMVRFCRGDGPDARRLCQRSLDLFDEIGDKRGKAFALRDLGVITLGMNDVVAARRYLSECLAIRRSIGNRWGIAEVLYQLGVAAWSVGDREQAFQELRAALRTAVDVNAMALALQVLAGLAELRARPGETGDAAVILAAIASHPASEPAVQDRARSLLLALDPHATSDLAPERADQIVREQIRLLLA